MKAYFITALLLLILAGCAGGDAAPVEEFLHPPTVGPTPTLYPPAEVDLGPLLDESGRAIEPLQLVSPDGCLRLDVDAGISLTGPDGGPPASLVISQDYPGKLPLEAYGVSISYAYRFGPQEVRFSEPVRFEFSCLRSYKQTMLNSISLGMLGDEGGWDQISVDGDSDSIWSRWDQLQPGWQYLLVGPAPMGS